MNRSMLSKAENQVEGTRNTSKSHMRVNRRNWAERMCPEIVTLGEILVEGFIRKAKRKPSQ